MSERLASPRLADMVEAMDRIARTLEGVSLEAFENDWERRWLVVRGVEVVSEASSHLTRRVEGAARRHSMAQGG